MYRIVAYRDITSPCLARVSEWEAFSALLEFAATFTIKLPMIVRLVSLIDTWSQRIAPDRLSFGICYMGKSVRLNDTVFIDEMRDNWPILATGFLCMLFAFSAPGFSMPFLFRSVIEEFGWTREQATLLASAKYATGAVVAIIIGRAQSTRSGSGLH